MEDRPRLIEVSRHVDRKLPIDAQHFACGHPSHRAKRSQLGLSEQSSCPLRIPRASGFAVAELANEDEEAVWVASELERLHRAGTPWRDFAILYRQHNHRDRLARELAERKIPFVISRLSILEHPLVRDVLSYLRIINKPFDDIACARVLAAPAWHLEPVDLVRLAERTRKKRTSIYDMLQSPQSDLPFDPSPKALAELLDSSRRRGRL